MPKTKESFDDYITNAQLYKIDVTQLNMKKARKKFLVSLLLFLPIYQLFFWAGFYGLLFFIYPHFTKFFLLPPALFLSVCILVVNIGAIRKVENFTLLIILFCVPLAASFLVYFITSLFHAFEISNDAILFLGISTPWNYILFLVSMAVYAYAFVSSWKSAGIEKSLKAIYASKCIDFDRKLYAIDLDDRVFKDNLKPTRTDRILVRALLIMTPFIQVAILKSTGNGPISAIFFSLGLYFLSLGLLCVTCKLLRNYQAIKKIQNNLGFNLTPIKSDRKEESFASMGWYRSR